nr:hypothetical protein [uncultured Duganella sp.]
MKLIKTALSIALMLACGYTLALDNCGPGTSDPKCDAHNKERERMNKAEQDKRRDDASKQDGTYGRTGEKKDSKDSTKNDSARTISK